MKNRFKELTAFILASFLLFCLVTPCLAEEEEEEDSLWSKVTNTVSNAVNDVKSYVTDDDLEEEPEEEDSTSVQVIKTNPSKTPTTEEFCSDVASGIDNITKKDTVSLEEAKVNESDSKTNLSTDEDEGGLLSGEFLKKTIGEGIAYGFEYIASQGYKLGFNTTSEDQMSVKKNYGTAVAIIYILATVEFNPLENDFVRDMIIKTNEIGLFMIIFFVLLGAINVNWYRLTSMKNRQKAYILSTRFHIPMNEYVFTIIEACILMIFGYIILWITLTTETWLTKQLMIPILDRIAPTGENIIMYIMMSICYVVLSVVIGLRLLIIGMFCGSYLIFVGLYCFGISRETAEQAFFYYLQVLFLRSAIVGITVFGVGIISSIKINPEATALMQILQGFGILYLTPILYASLMIILLAVGLVMIIGIRNVIRAERLATRRRRHTW
jgi:hypothetical protein